MAEDPCLDLEALQQKVSEEVDCQNKRNLISVLIGQECRTPWLALKGKNLMLHLNETSINHPKEQSKQSKGNILRKWYF